MRAIPAIGEALAWLGRRGPLLLVLSLAAGFSAPELGRLAAPALPLAAFLLVWGSFLAAGLSERETPRGGATLAAALAFISLGTFTATLLVLRFASLAQDIELAAVAASLAPPTGSLAAVAAMLALRPRLALALMLTLTLAAPLTMPLLMAAFAIGDSALWLSMGVRLIVIVGVAGLAAAPPVRSRLKAAGVLPGPSAACGFSVIGLVMVGLAAAGSVAELAATPDRLFGFFALALGLNLGLTLAGAALFARCGTGAALTIGLAAGNRNVTLVWAASAAVMSAAAQSYLAVCVTTILALPLLLKIGLDLRAAPPPLSSGAGSRR